MYDHASAFAKLDYIDWLQDQRQNSKYAVGDIVYIYHAAPYKKVMFKTRILKTCIPFRECIDDFDFWTDLDAYEKRKNGLHMRLQLIDQSDNEKLTLILLKKNGLKGAPQRQHIISEKLANYIDSYLKDDYVEGFFPESDIPSNSYEGAVKTTVVNKYERSSIAREKCIEYYGCKCMVCGLVFEDFYGEIGKGFIHVHHVVPLSTVGKEYVVDYKKDLVPICPNCHAMLHRTLDGEMISVEQLQDMIRKKLERK